MGVDKAQVTVGSRTMLEHVAEALRAVTDAVVLAGGATPVPDMQIVSDPPGFTHQGPLAGLASAAAALRDSLLVVVAVDQPWVQADTLRRLIETGGHLPVVPVEDGVRQTTCAVYPAAALDGANDELSGGGSIQSLLDRVSFTPVIDETWAGWGEDGRSWFSVDTAADIARGLERYGAP
jgi:molybdopterin-guanine dinucleotide biosynthesis protein A